MEENQPTVVIPTPSNGFLQKFHFFADRFLTKKTISFAVFLLIAVNIPVALYLTQQRQNIKQHAATNGILKFYDVATEISLNTTTGEITQTTDPNIKLQILIPDNWELTSATASSRINFIPQAYAQSTTPSVTATPSATLTPTETLTPSPTSTPSATPSISITSTPSATLTPTSTLSPTPTTGVLKKILSKITIKNAVAGGDEEKILNNRQEIIEVLNKGTHWKLPSLTATETTAVRSVTVIFEGTLSDNTTIKEEATATITLLKAAETPTTTPAATIDILDYFISKHQDKGLTGTHPLSQFVDGQRAYYMKWQKAGDPTGKSSIFEVYTWDNDNIYLKEDHSGAPVNFYTFAPGTWMKRHMAIGEKITVSSNTIQWYDPTCNAVAPNNQPFPIEVTLEREDPQYDLGGDLDKQNVIIVKYDSKPNSTDGIFERFYYSKEWGWVKWEEYNKTTNTITNTSLFNTIVQTPPLQPHLSAACTPEFRTANISPTPTPNPLGATLHFSPASSSASAGMIVKQVGDDILLDILLDPNGEIIVVGTLVIKYDPTSLEAKTFTTTTGGNGTIGNGTASLPTIGLSETSTSMGIRTNGTKIATITFKAIKETPLTQVNFDMSQSNLTSAINQAVNVLKQTPNPAYITIGTLTTSPTPTSAISPIPTMTLMPTPTIAAGNTAFTIKVALQGIGRTGNETPIYQQRTFSVMLFDSNGVGVGSTVPNAILTFNPATNLFEGQADMGRPTPGNYTVKAKTNKYLTKVISNILPIVDGTTSYTLPAIPTLVAGDLNNDNQLNIQDYNMYKNCLGKNTAECVIDSDLNDDGYTDTIVPIPSFVDYRLLINNFSLQKGD